MKTHRLTRRNETLHSTRLIGRNRLMSATNMKCTNKETGVDVTSFVIQLLEKKITQAEFEKLTGLKN
jgi:hypothetical protein